MFSRRFCRSVMAFSAVCLSSLPAYAQLESVAYVGEIVLIAGPFCPRGTYELNGQHLSIGDNPVLYSVVGNNYGGNGRIDFALPDMRARRPVHDGQGPGLSAIDTAQSGGTAEVVMTVDHLPVHSHASGLAPHQHNLPDHSHTASLSVSASGGATNDPSGAVFARFNDPAKIYRDDGPSDVTLAAGSAVIDEATIHLSPQPDPNVRTQMAGEAETAIAIVPPGLGVRFCMVAEGVYPRPEGAR